MTRAHPDIDAYIDRLPPRQQEICRELRGVIWAADAGIEETIKRSVDVPALTEMLRAIVANNRAGGWRRLRA